MNKLAQLSNIKRDFLKFEMYGFQNALVEEKGNGEDFMPLIVVCNPPDASFVMGSKMMTSFITQHVEDFGTVIKQIQATKDERAKKQMLDKMQNQMSNSLVKEFENPAEIFTKAMTLGKEYLLTHTDSCYYEHEPDKRVPLRFVADEKAQKEVMESGVLGKEGQAVLINILSQDDLTYVGTYLLDGKTPKTPIPNIPIENGEGGESSVPADELGKFPVVLGTNVVANVPVKRD
jgi:hypothetical protein